jgi:MscS family membrane protein
MEQLKQALSFTFLGIESYAYIGAFASIVGGFILKMFLDLVIKRLRKLTSQTKTGFDDIAIHSLEKPLGWVGVMVGLYLALRFLPLPVEPVDVRRFVDAVMQTASVLLMVWFASRLVDGIMEAWQKKATESEGKLDDQIVPIVRSSARVFIFLIGIVIILQNMGYSVGSLLAGLGIGGAAIALASKDTIANLFGSLVIFLDRPFQIGDWIETGSVEGTVETVGLRTTQVRTFANSLITIPNATFTNTAINNWSRMKKRRIKMTVGVTYDTTADQMEEAVKRIRQIIAEDENIHHDYYLVNFDAFGPSSLDIFIYCFTVTTNWDQFLDAKQKFMLNVMRALQEMGLSFAFPTQTVHVESLPGEPIAMTSERPQ